MKTPIGMTMIFRRREQEEDILYYRRMERITYGGLLVAYMVLIFTVSTPGMFSFGIHISVVCLAAAAIVYGNLVNAYAVRQVDEAVREMAVYIKRVRREKTATSQPA